MYVLLIQWSAGDTYRFLLFHFMWFLMCKRESADPHSSLVIKKTPLLDPIPRNRCCIWFHLEAKAVEEKGHTTMKDNLLWNQCVWLLNSGSYWAFPSNDIQIHNYSSLHVVLVVQRASVCFILIFQIFPFVVSQVEWWGKFSFTTLKDSYPWLQEAFWLLTF